MSIVAAATGIGSWPGTSPRQAAEVVVGELHTLPHLVELPARGVGADMIGRAGALLVDIGIDTTPRGYRIASGRSAVARRSASLLDEDLDALEEAWEKAGQRGGTRTVKVQAPGPITLAAQLELSAGRFSGMEGTSADIAAHYLPRLAQKFQGLPPEVRAAGARLAIASQRRSTGRRRYPAAQLTNAANSVVP